MRNHRIFLLPAVTLLAGMMLCGGLSCDGPVTSPLIADLVLTDSLGQPTTSFTLGDPITFELSIYNPTASPVTLNFSDGQKYEFLVYQDGDSQPLWRWSRCSLFTAALTEITLTPGETRTFTEVWDQTDNVGCFVDPGIPIGSGPYEAKGYFTTPDYNLEYIRRTVSFGVF